MLADRLQPGVVAQSQISGHRLTWCRVCATDRAAALTSYESDDDDAYGSFGRPLAHALEFLHTE